MCNRFRIIKLLEFLINICNKIIVQTPMIILRIDIHFEARKQSIKITNFNQINLKLLYIVIYQQREKLVYLDFKIHLWMTIFSYWIGITPLTRKPHLSIAMLNLLLTESTQDSFKPSRVGECGSLWEMETWWYEWKKDSELLDTPFSNSDETYP